MDSKMKNRAKRSRKKSDTTPKAKKGTGSVRLAELAYRRILEGLFDRRVPAGAFLSQSDLVRIVDIPVQPLRDALRVLETEGIVKIHPRSGIQFLKADLELARSTYQFRSIIERSAARSFAETGDAEECEALIDAHRSMLAKIESEGLPADISETMQTLESRFHGAMIASLRNPLIETAAKRLTNYAILVRMDRRLTSPIVLRTLREHLEVLEACTARDADAADSALARHFQAALQRILGM